MPWKFVATNFAESKLNNGCMVIVVIPNEPPMSALKWWFDDVVINPKINWAEDFFKWLKEIVHTNEYGQIEI